MQIGSPWIVLIQLLGLDQLKRPTKPSANKDVEHLGLPRTAIRSDVLVWKTVWQFLTVLNILLPDNLEILTDNFSSNIHYRKQTNNNQETTHCPLTDEVDKQIVVHPFHGLLLSNRRTNCWYRQQLDESKKLS